TPMVNRLISALGFAPDSTRLNRFGESVCVLGHIVATSCALYGLYLIVAGSLDSAPHGVALFGIAIALDVVLASRCSEKRARRQAAHPPAQNVRSRGRKNSS